MLIRTIIFILIVLVCGESLSQQFTIPIDSVNNNVAFPAESINATIYIEKYDAISLYEYQILLDSLNEDQSSLMVEQFQRYNDEVYRKYNREVNEFMSAVKSESFESIYSQDFMESPRPSQRYIIKCVNPLELDKNSINFFHSEGYYLYDRIDKIRFSIFYDKDNFVRAFEKTQRKFRRKDATKSEIEDYGEIWMANIQKGKYRPPGVVAMLVIAPIMLFILAFIT